MIVSGAPVIERVKPEVMSPVGYWPQLYAAIEAGADAVYFGLRHFSARAKVGFAHDELADVMRTLHLRGVRGYLTFNTLVFDEELREAARALEQIARTGVDAILVQDVGIAALARDIAPDLPVHGSTQMSITSAEGVAFAQSFGVRRVVLARELSLDDVRAIREQTTCELEMFVHGALCVSYSGQCFSSEAWGGRSANRGQCAQACRLPYELVVDEVVHPLGDKRYLLSPGDLYALEQVPEIVQIGISALKIEGRYKDAEYVALTTAAYRKAVDDAWSGLSRPPDERERLQLDQVYSRGSGPWFVTGVNHQVVVEGRSPRHRGLLVAKVTRVLHSAVVVEPSAAAQRSPIKPGDGLVFDAAAWRSPEEPEEGGRLYEVVQRKGNQLELRFGNGLIDFTRIRVGDWVWRSHDPEVERAARRYTEARVPLRRQVVHVTVTAHEGAPLKTVWSLADAPELSVTVSSPEALPAAELRGVTLESLRDQLGRLGNTPYDLGNVTLQTEGAPFAPVSLLNDLRRQAVAALALQQGSLTQRTVRNAAAVLAAALPVAPQMASQPQAVALHLLVRTADQLDAAIDSRPASITLDYLELYGLRPAIERVEAADIEVRVASPRVLKPNEQRILNFLLRLDKPILVRSAGLVQSLQEAIHPPLYGDFSLNTANALTAQLFLAMGLVRITPTHDLNAAQVEALAQSIGPQAIEAIAYQHLPVFHMEHCVFCRFLSQGTSYKDCGHPCETHRLALRDLTGREHPVLADVGCRNTVFGSEAQQAASFLASWQRAGIRHLRLEFAHESAQEVALVTSLFQSALHGEITQQELERRLRRAAPRGITQGSLFVPNEIPLITL